MEKWIKGRFEFYMNFELGCKKCLDGSKETFECKVIGGLLKFQMEKYFRRENLQKNCRSNKK